MTAAAAADQYPRVHLTLKAGEPPMLNVRTKTVSELNSVIKDAEKDEYLGPIFFTQPVGAAASEPTVAPTEEAAPAETAPAPATPEVVDPGKALEALKAEIAAKNAAETPAPQAEAAENDPLARARALMLAKGGDS